MNLNEQAAAKAAKKFPYWNNDMSDRTRVLKSRCDYESGYLAGHAEANEWKDISEAPKDGTEILVFASNRPAGKECTVAFWEDGEWAFLKNEELGLLLTLADQITHFMPLPQPPTK